MKSFLKTCAIAVSGFIIGVILLYGNHIHKRPDLKVWHLTELSEELTSEEIGQMSVLQEYIKREELLFKQLEIEIVDNVIESDGGKINRYFKSGLSNPQHFEPEWNKTVNLVVDSPKAAVLMLHGLSDSPYSMHALARRFHNLNCRVTVLRLPGHGTSPSGLLTVKWQDFAAAVRLAVRDLTATTPPGTPLYIAGYSNGAALAIEYSLSRLLGEQLPQPAGLIMISPAVGVSSLAAMAKWNLRLAALPGLSKLAWLSLGPEYDPYKYNSFAVNGGEQVYQITRRIQRQITKLDQGKGVEHFPPTLVLQSVVDATTSPHAVIDNFLSRLSPDKHRLILFDINHIAAEMTFMEHSLQPTIEKMLRDPLPFGFTLVTNRDKEGSAVTIVEKKAMTKDVRTVKIELAWPAGIYSLSHVALPFPFDDPLYGMQPQSQTYGYNLGILEPRGEKNLLQVPMADLMRLRCNPFYPYLEQELVKLIIPEHDAAN